MEIVGRYRWGDALPGIPARTESKITKQTAHTGVSVWVFLGLKPQVLEGDDCADV